MSHARGPFGQPDSAARRLTPLRDLVSGSPPWPPTQVPHVRTWPRSPVTTEVAIVGTGISGAIVADALTGAGHEVVLIDRRLPIGGSTRASTALVQYDLDTPLIRLSRRIGRSRAEQVWRRSRLAVVALNDRIRRLNLQCDWEERPTLFLNGMTLSARGLRAEAIARRCAGSIAEFLTPPELERVSGIRGRSAVWTPCNYQCDPTRLTSGLLWCAVERGACILAPFEVTGAEPGRSRVELETREGYRLRARFVVFATGYELPKYVPAQGHRIQSTWAIEVQPARCHVAPLRHLIWEASDPYLYIRAAHAGKLLCGGADEPFADEASRDALLAAKTRILHRSLRRLLPALDGVVTRAWCGSFGDSLNGTPTIGRIPNYPSCYCLLGYGGNGITFAMLAAQIICSDIAGKPDADAALFAIQRHWSV